MVVFRHSAVLPSGVVSRARGTRLVVAPKVPIKLCCRWPWRELTAPIGELPSPLPFISISSRCGVQLGLEKLLDEAPNARAHPSFQGIKPIIAKKMSSFGGTDR
jgi:hypothetical protein